MKRILTFMACVIALASCTVETIPMLNCSITSVTLDYTGVAKTVEFTASTDWTASADADWVTLQPVSGSGSTTEHSILSIGASDNSDGGFRTSIITIRCGSLVKKITVIQSSRNGLMVGDTFISMQYAGYLHLTSSSSSVYVLSFSDAELDPEQGNAQQGHPWIYFMVTSLTSGDLSTLERAIYYESTAPTISGTTLTLTSLSYTLDAIADTISITAAGEDMNFEYCGPVTKINYIR